MKVFFIDSKGHQAKAILEQLESKGCEFLVYSNHADTKAALSALNKFRPKLVIAGPGPKTDNDNAKAIINESSRSIPIFGIGKGMHDIIEAFEGHAGKLHEPAIAKSSQISHDSIGIFKGVKNNFLAGRYHALQAIDVPYSFEISARSEDDIIMGIRHKELPIAGILFDPVSILTEEGNKILDNALKELKK